MSKNKNKEKDTAKFATRLLCIILALLMVGSFIIYLLYAVAGIF